MNDITEMSFEEAFDAMNDIIEQLESGKLSLSDSVTLYQQGQQLRAHCEALLDEAHLKIEQLNEDGSTTNLG